jgi:hypothetical protein
MNTERQRTMDMDRHGRPRGALILQANWMWGGGTLLWRTIKAG